MTKDVKFMTVVGVLSSFMLLGSGYLIEFQNWLAFNQSSSLNTIKQGSQAVSGIRSIVFQAPATEKLLTNDTSLVDAEIDVDKISAVNPISSKTSQIDKIPAVNTKPVDEIFAEFVNPADKVMPPSVEQSKFEHTELPFFSELEDELWIEFPLQWSIAKKKQAITRLLTLPDFADVQQLVSKSAIDTKAKPYYYKRVLNQYKTPIRYPAQAYRYADYLLVHQSEIISETTGDYQLIRIPLHERSLPNEVKNYHAWVETYAKQFDIAPELVFAIMQTESAFNPKAVSRSNALGLMQIKPKSAGRDVYELIDGRNDYPTQKVLFNPQENIRIGTAYMGLLKNKYLKQVRNAESRELLMIASYNGGLSKALALFGKTPEAAIERINQLYPRNIYRKLRHAHTSSETRRYVEKVLKNKEKFTKVLQEVA